MNTPTANSRAVPRQGRQGEEPAPGDRHRAQGGRRLQVREREGEPAEPRSSKPKEATGRTDQQETEGKGRVGARGKRESTRAMGGRNAKAPARRRRLAAPPQRAGRAMSKARRIVNLAEVALKDNGDGKSFQARVGRVGPMLGLSGLGLHAHRGAARQARLSISSPSCVQRAVLHPRPAAAKSASTTARCRFVPVI